MKIIDKKSKEYEIYSFWIDLISKELQNIELFYKTHSDRDYYSEEIIPLPKEIVEVIELLEKHNTPGNNILIVDDIDFDGTGACYIVYQYLKRFHRSSVHIHCNNKHGFDGASILSILKEIDYKVDLIIIVDSSTNLIKSYISDDNIESDILILDHHELDENLQDIKYTLPKGNILVNCNSTRTDELACISAGMLCYVVMNYYYKMYGTVEDTDDFYDDELGSVTIKSEKKYNTLYEVGAVTNISDIVPVDETVMRIIIDYLLYHSKETEIINDLLRSPTIKIDKYQLQWRIIPLINYTRRLADHSTIKLIYHGNTKAAQQYLQKNHSIGRNIVKELEDSTEPKIYNRFVYTDITNKAYSVGNYLYRFTGLYCNQLQSRYQMPSVVSIKTDEGIKISVRSTSINSLKYFSEIKNIEGGGHKSACGFMIPSYDLLNNILDGYDNYLKTAEFEESILCNAEDMTTLLKEFDLYTVSLYNELCFSNLQPMIFAVKHIDDVGTENLYKISQHEYTLYIGNTVNRTALRITTDGSLYNPSKDSVIKPLYDPSINEKFRLLVKNI